MLRFRRLRQQHRRIAPLRMLWCGATDLIPVAVPLTGLVVSDNTTGYMAAVMWLVWIWMLTVLPRLVYYIFRLLHLRRTGIVIACGIIAALIWGATLGRTGVHVSRVEVCSPRLPAGFDGMRIVQLSDMHLGTIVSPERELTRIVDSVNALHPELVIFTGDLVNIRASELDKRAVRLLRRIEAPVVSVTGNHDVGSYIKDTVSLPREQSHADLLAAQRAMGWRVLDDETLYLHRGGDSISLSGVSFDPALRKQRHDSDLEATNLDRVYAGVPDSLYNLTAVHLPQLWEQITARGYGDLTLAGHVHAMQFKVRLFGRAWSPAAWLYERWSGRYDEQGRTLYINDGTGYVAYPMRLGAWPEVTLFTLKRCE
ncbi:metallophosphoesterase [uncultured Alistipes sp.]|uniref:metallophosphoesterase n=1 Tax=uncultured Alistipes sp. TaxID=538949 RepID=UPI0028057A85|nr:metallophosphoesterase [uncultured Alistipes sp.]